MPNRLLKESICTSETIEKLKPFDETFFYRLIVHCDDYGRTDARPRVLKSRLFPLKDGVTLKNIEDGLRALVSAGLVNLYEVGGKPFLFLPTWEAHQRVRAKQSKYPAPDSICCHMTADDSRCPRNPIQSESESESNPSMCAAGASQPTQPSRRFVKPTVEEIAEYSRTRPIQIDAQKFYDFYESKGWVVGKSPMKDWRAAVRTWERDDKNKQEVTADATAQRPKYGDIF